jgi:uncharacterized membrane protein
MANAVLIVVGVIYPFLVYLLLDRFEPRAIALGLMCLLAIRFLFVGSRSRADSADARQMKWMVGVLGAFALGAAVLNSRSALLYYPLLVDVGLLAVFGISLVHPPTVIERIARLTNPHMPERAVRYTRAVTIVWCGFFVVNGAIAAWTAAFASLATWSVYNGFIAYVLMGALLAGEWLVRRRVRPR